MKWASLIGITAVAILIVLFEWSRINKNLKKEKWIVVIITMSGWILAILLVFFSDIPGPADLINMIFKPLGKFLLNPID
ncbi:hypothetical protein [Bacillus alveayuensis]|jgi:predicted membrane metal-binding protein|uniref:hypothetical protein n=1 Tax=Aeribacillus alveayuensis TaxID=279215 RepID=UPI0005D1187C|nr:hypothetical protein [Bacillus alveayuensis]